MNEEPDGVVDHADEAAEHGGTHAVVETHGDGGHQEPKVIDVSGQMFFWTLGTFLVMAFVLKRIAWKPILENLDKRESYIRESVENAEKVGREFASIESKRHEVISEADDKAKDIISRARKAGLEAERVIEDKAKEEAGILMENAEREIRSAREKAQADLKRESVDAAIALAGKLIAENLDTEKNRELTEKLIGRM